MIGPVSVDDGTEGLARPPVRGHVGDVEAVGCQLQPRPQLQSLAASRPRRARHPPHCSGVQLIHVFIVVNTDFLYPPCLYFCTGCSLYYSPTVTMWLSMSIVHMLQIKVLLCKYRVISGSCKIVGAKILIILKENMHFKLLSIVPHLHIKHFILELSHLT